MNMCGLVNLQKRRNISYGMAFDITKIKRPNELIHIILKRGGAPNMFFWAWPPPTCVCVKCGIPLAFRKPSTHAFAGVAVTCQKCLCIPFAGNVGGGGIRAYLRPGRNLRWVLFGKIEHFPLRRWFDIFEIGSTLQRVNHGPQIETPTFPILVAGWGPASRCRVRWVTEGVSSALVGDFFGRKNIRIPVNIEIWNRCSRTQSWQNHQAKNNIRGIFNPSDQSSFPERSDII